MPSYSEAGQPPAPEHVYRILEEHGERIAGIESSQQNFELGQAKMLVKLESIAQTDRHALTKLIVGLATTAITVIAGQRLLAPSPAPPVPPVPARSELDVRLDVCRAIPPGASREGCFATTLERVDH